MLRKIPKSAGTKIPEYAGLYDLEVSNAKSTGFKK